MNWLFIRNIFYRKQNIFLYKNRRNGGHLLPFTSKHFRNMWLVSKINKYMFVFMERERSKFKYILNCGTIFVVLITWIALYDHVLFVCTDVVYKMRGKTKGNRIKYCSSLYNLYGSVERSGFMKLSGLNNMNLKRGVMQWISNMRTCRVHFIYEGKLIVVVRIMCRHKLNMHQEFYERHTIRNVGFDLYCVDNIIY